MYQLKNTKKNNRHIDGLFPSICFMSVVPDDRIELPTDDYKLILMEPLLRIELRSPSYKGGAKTFQL